MANILGSLVAMFRLPCALLSVVLIVPGMVERVGAETVSTTARATGQKKTLNLHFVRAKRLSVTMPVIGTGTIFAHKSSKIGPLVEGQVEKVHVNVGDRVDKDQPLFEIRPKPYQSAYEEAEARLAMAEAKLSNAKPAYERTKQLYGRRTTSKAQLDRAISSLAVVHSEIALAKAGIKRAKQDLRDTVLRAPFKGVVTSRYLDEGVFLSPRIPGGNSAVIEVQKIDVVVAIIQVPARVLEKLFVGARAKLRIDGITKAVEAKVTIINDKVNIATRSVEVRIAVLNGGNTIKPGLFVRAQIYPKSRDVVVIPRHTVKGPEGQRLVYVLEHGRAVRKQVRTVDHDATRVQVLSGLAEGDRVLSGPDLPHVSDGLQVGEVQDVAG